MIFLVQFGRNKHSKIFQRLQIALAYGLVQFCVVFENLLVLIYSKLHSISYTNCIAVQ